MLTGNPGLEPWLMAQFAVPLAVALLGNGALVVVAATAARRQPSQGWIWLFCAGLFGLLRLLLSPLSTTTFSILASRYEIETAVKVNAVLSIIGALIGGAWWLLLILGIRGLCASPAQRASP